MSSPEDQQFQELTPDPSTLPKRDQCVQTDPNAPNCAACSQQCSSAKTKDKNQQKSGKLLSEIHRLKVQIGLLKLQNEALNKSISTGQDTYYEDVINGMQQKIHELTERAQPEN